MKKVFASAGLFLALAAVRGPVMNQFTPPPAAGQSAHAGIAASQHGSAKKQAAVSHPQPAADAAVKEKTEQPCAEGPDNLRDFLNSFLRGGASKTRANEDYAPLSKDMQPRVIFATAPDPRHTHLSLMFDRQIEAIEQAASDERYDFHAAWMPWRSHEDDYSGFDDKEKAEEEAAQREACPGLMIFREGIWPPVHGDTSYGHPLFVFVIADKPTAGINTVQFQTALNILARIGYQASAKADSQADGPPLAVLGPSFSGSMPSLVRFLNLTSLKTSSILNLPAGEQTLAFSRTRIYGGSVSSADSVHWLYDASSPLCEAKPSLPNPVPCNDPTFRFFLQSDQLNMQRVYAMLGTPDPKRVAVLSEDETVYGANPEREKTEQTIEANKVGKPEQPPVEIQYPRDISAVRNAYQKQSIFSGGKEQKQEQSQYHSSLDATMEEDEQSLQEGDSVRTYAGHVTPVSEEAVLDGIVAMLRTHSVRYVLLRGTNPLDQLFLVQFLHRNYPIARVVVVGADMLMARDGNADFRGTLVVSNYPLLPRISDWTEVPESLSGRVFTSQIAEGNYRAARALIAEVEGRNELGALRPDVVAPAWLHQPGNPLAEEPATWLSVVARDGFWPVTATVEDKNGKTLNILTPVQPKAPQSQNPPLTPTWILAVAISTLIGLLHIIAIWLGRSNHNLSLLSYFTPVDGWRFRLLQVVGAIFVASPLFVLSIALVDQGRVAAPHGGLPAFLSAFGAAAIMVFAARLGLYRTTSPEHKVPRDGELRKQVGIALGAGVVGGIVVPMLCGGLFGAMSGMFAYRSAHLLSGVSPVLPLLVFSIGYYYWFVQGLIGLSIFDDSRPRLPDFDSYRSIRFPISRHAANKVRCAATPIPRELLPYLVSGLVLFLVCVVAFHTGSPIQSFERGGYNSVINFLWLLGSALTVLEATQLVVIWRRFQRILSGLDRIHLRRTFSFMRCYGWRTLWQMGSSLPRVRTTMIRRQYEALRALQLAARSLPPAGSEGADEYHALSNDPEMEACRFAIDHTVTIAAKHLEDRPKKHKLPNMPMSEVQDWFSVTAGELILVLENSWGRERPAAPEGDSSPSKQDDENEGNQADEDFLIPVRKLTEFVRYAEHFVCLLYVSYIQNTQARMRGLVFSLLGFFLASFVAMNVYPFTGKSILLFVMLSLLALLTGVVAYVYAGMDRDPILSRITDSQPGKIDASFWLKMAGFLAPVIFSLVATQFPSIADSVSGWVQPLLSTKE